MTNVTMVDDLDAGKAAETVSFGLDGVDYEIDLSKRNAAALRKTVAEFVAAARAATPHRQARHAPRAAAKARKAAARRGAAKPTSQTARPDPAAVRHWARGSGIDVSARGRIADNVIAQYEAAQTEPDSTPSLPADPNTAEQQTPAERAVATRRSVTPPEAT